MATHYKIGTGDPITQHDPGAGPWNSQPQTQDCIGLKFRIWGHLPHAALIIGDDAAKHMHHYFKNTGNAKDVYKNEIEKAKLFVGTLSNGTHNITTDTAVGGYNFKNENWNWYYAVGGYKAWITGVAEVEADNNGNRKYRLDYEYKVADRYNWDKDKKVEIFGKEFTDEFMGEFHRQGMAREFNVYGSIKASIEWDSQSPGTHTVVPLSTGR